MDINRMIFTWITSYYGIYRLLMEAINGMEDYKAAEVIKTLVEDRCPLDAQKLEGFDLMYLDMIQHCIAEADWRDIARRLLEK